MVETTTDETASVVEVVSTADETGELAKTEDEAVVSPTALDVVSVIE